MSTNITAGVGSAQGPDLSGFSRPSQSGWQTKGIGPGPIVTSPLVLTERQKAIASSFALYLSQATDDPGNVPNLRAQQNKFVSELRDISLISSPSGLDVARKLRPLIAAVDSGNVQSIGNAAALLGPALQSAIDGGESVGGGLSSDRAKSLLATLFR